MTMKDNRGKRKEGDFQFPYFFFPIINDRFVILKLCASVIEIPHPKFRECPLR